MVHDEVYTHCQPQKLLESPNDPPVCLVVEVSGRTTFETVAVRVPCPSRVSPVTSVPSLLKDLLHCHYLCRTCFRRLIVTTT